MVRHRLAGGDIHHHVDELELSQLGGTTIVQLADPEPAISPPVRCSGLVIGTVHLRLLPWPDRMAAHRPPTEVLDRLRARLTRSNQVAAVASIIWSSWLIG